MRDPEKMRARQRRYRDRKHAECFGPNAGDMRGRHGNHARREKNARWAGDKLQTSHGYVAVRVPPDHPHAWGPPGLKNCRYAYEHVVLMVEKIGRPLREYELVHHKNRDKTDNREENLELLTVSEHAKEHSELRGRDQLGRFPPEDLRVREFPEA